VSLALGTVHDSLRELGKADACGPLYCSGFCPQSRRGTAPSENPAQDAERHKGERTKTPASKGAKRTRTPKLTQTQRWFIHWSRSTSELPLIYPQEKQNAHTNPAHEAVMGGPVPRGPRPHIPPPFRRTHWCLPSQSLLAQPRRGGRSAARVMRRRRRSRKSGTQKAGRGL